MVEPKPDTSACASVDPCARGQAAPDVMMTLPPHDTNIYNFETLQSIANGLDFQKENQRSRDGAKQILLHSHNLPNDNLKYQIFDLANRVPKYSNLSTNLRKRVIKVATTVLFYDQGYHSVRGISKINHTSRARMEEFYRTSNNIRPLKGRYKGRVSHIDKLE